MAVLDTGFYPNWRDYFVDSDILTQYARAFVAANGNQNANQWDVGSDPHGMATAATITATGSSTTPTRAAGGRLCHRRRRDLLGASGGPGDQCHPGQGL